MTGQSIQQRITAILAEHWFCAIRYKREGKCWACGWRGTETEHRDHVAGVLVEALGLTPEYAVCIEDDDGGVLLYGDYRYLRASVAATQLRNPGQFVGTAWTTRWERADG